MSNANGKKAKIAKLILACILILLLFFSTFFYFLTEEKWQAKEASKAQPNMAQTQAVPA